MPFRLTAALLAAAVLFAPCTLAQVGATPPPITLRVVADGFGAPTALAAPHDGSGRLFVTEQTGRVRIVRGAAILPVPFLDLTGRVSTNQERGLLGIAFDPAFATNRRFFVYYTMLPDDGTGGAIRISSFLASAGNPDVADPASEREVITIPHPINANHNGGQLAFGPDGYLYAGIGDGGGAGDVPNNAQSLNVLLGKILRLDVSPPSGYAIPPDNPAFAGVPGARREIWAYGLRNPWRFSFDRKTGDLYIGDVGQNSTEEIDYVPAGTPPGLNFGWHVFEGTDCFSAPCTLSGATPPVLQYHHDAAGGIAVIGGYVYRGSRNPALLGYYLYGDFLSNRIWAATHGGTKWNTFLALAPPDALASNTAFGEDESGELYVLDYGAGRLFTIDAGAIDVALAANGASAIASSTFGPGYPVSAVIDGEAAGIGWTAGGGWADGTIDEFPDTVEIDFGGAKSIDRVVIYTVQDDYAAPAPPTDAMTFTKYGITDFDVQGWDGASWVTLGTVAGNNLVKRTVSFAPFNTSRIRINVTHALAAVARITEVEAWGGPAANLALASTGAVASASSRLSSDFPVASLNDGARFGDWTQGGGWADGTVSQWPDWVQIDFNGIQRLGKVVVYTLQDDYANAVEPSDTMTFSQYGVTGFDVQGWDGAQWVTLATVTGNNRVKRTVTFAPYVTTKLRITVTSGLFYVSRITEVEAYAAEGPLPGNVALASAGTVASAASQLSSDFPIASIIDGERFRNWTHGGGWADGTLSQWPDWVQLDFKGAKTLDHVVVYTVQDDYTNAVEPADTTTFTQYGITDFDVQGWDGSQWVTLATVIGNNRVKRTVSFAPYATPRVRINVTRALFYVSRITELEAWGVPAP